LKGSVGHFAANQQRGTHDQDKRERDFDDDEHRARPAVPRAGTRPAAAFLQSRRQVGLRSLERRNGAEEQSRPERDGECEQQHAPVQADE
jgi:hypothetical protein